MKRWVRHAGTVFALAFLALTVVNASWLAATPKGTVHLVADGAAAQQGGRAEPCPARAIEPPVHDFLENTAESIRRTGYLGAQFIVLDAAPTRDGRFVLLREADLSCRTDGQGLVSDHTLAELKALDAGYGYTADAGATHPFRGIGAGSIPSLEEGVAALGRARALYRLVSDRPADAERLAAALEAAGRDVDARRDGFLGVPAAVAVLRARFPQAWAWSVEEAEACTSAYRLSGWFGIVPESCRGGTLLVPVDGQWAFAGWPNRLLARMEAAGAHVLVTGPERSDGVFGGFDLPEQLGEVPSTYNGLIWVDDIWTVGPALRPTFNSRTEREEELLAAALERRRAGRE